MEIKKEHNEKDNLTLKQSAKDLFKALYNVAIAIGVELIWKKLKWQKKTNL